MIEGGRIHYDGSAQRLRDEPELLQSAYLLRDTAAAGAVPIEKVEIDVAPVEIPIDAPPTATAPSEAAPDASPSEPEARRNTLLQDAACVSQGGSACNSVLLAGRRAGQTPATAVCGRRINVSASGATGSGFSRARLTAGRGRAARSLRR